jgi:pyruvate dehydrogenase E2 component (dihydrolipoamide acetyltransferase)
MVTEIIMPKLGQTMEKGKIVRWLKKEGERVNKGEAILEIETDKAILEVEARDSGILKKILAKEGDVVPVAQVIGYITREGEEVPETSLEEKSEAAQARITETPHESEREIKASPLAKKIAKEKGVDLTQITGTGPGGRITEKDVLEYIARLETKKITPPAAAPGEKVIMAPPEEFQIVPISGMREAIARKTAYSKANIPHFYICVEVDMTEAARLKEELTPIIESKVGVRLSFTHIIVKATALALREYPQLNAVCDGENIKISKNINIGIVVGLEDGLVVPVLKNADSLDLARMAAKIEELISKAREKRLSEDEFAGSSFTISNLGMLDVDSFTAIINPPEVAILAIGKIKDKPAVINGEIKVRKMMNLTLSADHRAVDGIIAAKFLNRVKMLLEKPYSLLLS